MPPQMQIRGALQNGYQYLLLILCRRECFIEFFSKIFLIDIQILVKHELNLTNFSNLVIKS